MIEVKVHTLAVDDRTKAPVVLLQEIEGSRVLPIWIGPSEASAIAMELAGKRFQRPLTHDLMKALIEGLNARVAKVAITDLKDNTFYATVYLQREKDLVGVDARPSDSIALALRTHSPIFVTETLLGESITGQQASEEERAKALRKYLEEMNPEDFGRFTL